jgi:dihydropteroate synthase
MSAELPGGGGLFRVMGVVNVTPDSFSDGGLYLDPGAAVAHALELVADGAAILDVGGESTRPGAEPVPEGEERRRVVPVIEGLVAAGAQAQISIDSSKSAVAAAALDAGATLVNDVTALRADPAMASLVAASGADCCLMHMLGEPRTMQKDPRYEDVVSEVKAFLEERMAYAVSAGVAEERILLDPGIGFGKTAEQSMTALARLGELDAFGLPLLVGASRKSFINAVTPSEPHQRLGGSIAAHLIAAKSGARIIRTHDVSETVQALRVAAAIEDLT